jgi:hypothetical protein
MIYVQVAGKALNKQLKFSVAFYVRKRHSYSLFPVIFSLSHLPVNLRHPVAFLLYMQHKFLQTNTKLTLPFL